MVVAVGGGRWAVGGRWIWLVGWLVGGWVGGRAGGWVGGWLGRRVGGSTTSATTTTIVATNTAVAISTYPCTNQIDFWYLTAIFRYMGIDASLRL